MALNLLIPLLYDYQRQLKSAGDPNLFVDARQVVLDGLFGDAEQGRNLAIPTTFRHRPSNLELTRRQRA
jgi:hypothetical protein